VKAQMENSFALSLHRLGSKLVLCGEITENALQDLAKVCYEVLYLDALELQKFKWAWS